MKRSALVAVVALFFGSLVGATAQAEGSCGDPVPGGDWPSYGGDLSNSRTQDETSISPAWVDGMEVDWAVSASAIGGAGQFSNTPIIAEGCVFLATNAGSVYALNADDGSFVWGNTVTGQGQDLLGGVVVGSLVYHDGVVYAGVSQPGAPYVAAFDAIDGTPKWEAVVETGQKNSLINASPVAVGDKIFMGFSGNEGGSVARGGFAILRAGADCGGDEYLAGVDDPILRCFDPVVGETGGARLAHQWTITDDEYADGQRGASIWCTAAIDPAEMYVYACGGNPASKKIEPRYSNALLKIDINEGRSTFGTIVDSYKGDFDQYYPGLDRQPVCDAFGDDLVVVVWSLACLQLDLDFGSSPNLFRDRLGRLMMGALQKSGVYHTVHADEMGRGWTTIMGAPCAACNASSSAYAMVPDADGNLEGRIFVDATPGSILEAITSESGRYRWAYPVADGVHFQAVSTAGGVVFAIDNFGTLSMVDATTGLPIARRNLSEDISGVAVYQSSQGVAIARDQVYVNQDQWTIAYKSVS